MKRSLFAAGAALIASGAAMAPLSAQGSSVMTHSSCATALGGAQVAAPCSDGSAILFNPAGIVTQPSTIGVGYTAITTDGDFTYDFTGEVIEREEVTTPVPFGFATYRINDRLAAGFGVFAPYGLGIQWPMEFEGRFTAYDSELRNIYFQPTLAYRSGWLSFGAGVDVVSASIEINQRVDLAEQQVPGLPAGITFANVGVTRGTDFADVKLAGDGIGVGFHLGALMEVSERISFGARYMSEVEIDYDGTAAFEQIETGVVLPTGLAVDPVLAAQFGAGAPLEDQGLTTSLTLPAQLTVGAAVRPIPQLQLLVDYQWTGWESFGEAPIDFGGATATDQTLVLDYQNTDTYRVGAEFWATERLPIRAGFIYNTAAEREFSVSPLLPEADRNYYSAGIGYRFGNGVGIDLGYQHVDQSDRRGRVRGRPAGLTREQLEALNVGVYTADARVLNATVFYHFGGR